MTQEWSVVLSKLGAMLVKLCVSGSPWAEPGWEKEGERDTQV